MKHYTLTRTTPAGKTVAWPMPLTLRQVGKAVHDCLLDNEATRDRKAARQFGQAAEKAVLAGESLECYGYTFTATANI